MGSAVAILSRPCISYLSICLMSPCPLSYTPLTLQPPSCLSGDLLECTDLEQPYHHQPNAQQDPIAEGEPPVRGQHWLIETSTLPNWLFGLPM